MAPRSEVSPHGDDVNDPSQELKGGEDLPVEDRIAFLVSFMQDHPEDTTVADLALRLLVSS